MALEVAETPRGWRKTTIGSIATIRRGASPRPIQDPRWFSDSGPGWVRIADVTRSKRILSKTEQCLSAAGVTKTVLLKPGSLIMSICATIGKPIVLGIDACIHDGFVVFDGLSPEVYREFLYYFLQWRETAFASLGQHGTQKNLNTGIVSSAEVALPPLPEQHKIAAILSSVDDTIEKTEALSEQLEVVNKGMLDDLLTDISEGRVPEDVQKSSEWRMLCIGELGQFSGGNGFKPSDWSSAGLPIIRIQNLNDSQSFNYFSGMPESDWLVEPGELLFAWAGSRGSSFGPCLWPGPRGLLNQHIHRIKPFSFVDKRFLYFVLRRITAIIERRAHGFKDTLVHLRKSELTEWRIALPPLVEQRRYSAILDSVDERLQSERRRLGVARSLKSALLDVLVSGRIRVSIPGQDAA
jgi:type I restriction enzyme, S subunit